MSLPSSELLNSLLGKRVGVALTAEHLSNFKLITGKLLSWSEMGEAIIYDDMDDTVHFCWPILFVTEIPEDETTNTARNDRVRPGPSGVVEEGQHNGS